MTRAVTSARLAWAAVALGIGARIAWVLFGPSAVVTDAALYRTLALSLVRGAGYATAAGPSALRVPGWPAWMAVFYAAHTGDLGVALGNVLLGAATIGATYALARRAHGSGAARVAASIVALWPSLILLPKTLLSENLALPCVGIDVLLLAWAARPSASGLRWLVAGVACGATILVREACVALVPAAILLAVRLRRPLPLTAWVTFVIPVVFVLSPWLARNRDVMGVTRLTTSAGANLCIGFGEGATGGYRSLDDDPPGTDARGASGEVARNRAWIRCATEGLARDPLKPLVLAPGKLSRLLVWDDWVVDDFFAPRLQCSTAMVLRLACNGAYWVICALAVFGVVRRPLARNAVTRASAFVVLFVVAFVLASFGTGRFHVIVQPLFAVYAARGAFALRARF